MHKMTWAELFRIMQNERDAQMQEIGKLKAERERLEQEIEKLRNELAKLKANQ